MRRLILVAMIAGLLAPVGLHAQEVRLEDGKIILDLTEGTGMPADVSTSESKTEIYNDGGKFVPDNDDWGLTNIQKIDNLSTGSINATVYQKLEIALYDMNNTNSNTAITTTGTFTMDWATAFNGCKAANHNGSGSWRLPTQRELQLMYIFKDALNVANNDLRGTDFSSANYWSATEYDDSASWAVSFNSGYTYHNGKGPSTNQVRCVREIAPSTL